MIDKTSSAIDDYVPEKPSLKTGLLALKQKKYPQAIAQLKIIAQQEPLKQKLKAQMGLVIAYEKTKQVDKAISLCRNLTKISDKEIKSFANRYLQELLKQEPPKNLKKSTIYTPKTPEASPQNQQPIETGFVPFNPTSDQSLPAKNSNNISKQNIDLSIATGFQPISKKTNDFKTNPRKTSADKNNSPALSSIFNKSNSKTTNESNQTSTEITSDKPEPEKSKEEDVILMAQNSGPLRVKASGGIYTIDDLNKLL